jgi:hypothetical protein
MRIYGVLFKDAFEIDYVPWSTFIYHIDKISVLLQHRASFKHLRVRISKI